MTLILSGTDGLSDIDGSAATPAIRGTDANTGIFFGTDIIGFSEGGVEAMRINASGNVEMTGTLTTASRGIAKASMPAGAVLQVVSTNKTDTFSTSSTSFTDITSLSVSITPSSASNKILIMAYISAQGTPAATVTQHRLVRGATAIAVGDAASSRTQASAGLYSSVSDTTQQATIVFLDSPATTSSTTYKCQMRVNGSTGYVNRTSSDTDNANNARTISTITVMEIAV
jgi:hypothetical protein